MEELKLSVSRAADNLGVQRATLSDLLNEKAFGTSMDSERAKREGIDGELNGRSPSGGGDPVPCKLDGRITLPNPARIKPALVQRPDVDLVAHVGGSGPLVVLLHGFPDTWRTWDGVVAMLRARGFGTAALALRGYAPSGVPTDGDYGLRALAEDVVAIMDHLDVPRAHVIGHDWGASAAYVLAALHPTRVDRMVTLAIPPLAVFPSGWRERIARPHNLYLGWGAPSARLLRRNGGRLIDRLYQQWSPSWAAPADHLHRVRAALMPPERARAAVNYYGAREDLADPTAIARPIHTPTLAIYGADEPAVRRRAFARAAPVLGPGSEVVELSDVGHWPHLEAPDEVADRTMAFLDGTGTIG